MNNQEIDAEGNIVMKPVTGYAVSDVAGMAVLARIDYVESQEQLDIGDTRMIPLVLLPQQALELAAALTRAAQRVLAPTLPNVPRN